MTQYAKKKTPQKQMQKPTLYYALLKIALIGTILQIPYKCKCRSIIISVLGNNCFPSKWY